MTPEQIQRKVREFNAKTRRQFLGSLLAPLIVVACYGFAIARLDYPVLQPLFIPAIVWSLAGTYFLSRGMWSDAAPGGAALSTGLEAYRREIERRRNLFRRVLLWSFGPLLLAIGAFLLALAKFGGKPIFPNALPFIILVIAWIVGYFAIRMREQRELRREIAALSDMKRENGPMH